MASHLADATRAGLFRLFFGLNLMLIEVAPAIERNCLKLANLPMAGYFQSLICPLGCFANVEGRKPPRHRRNSVLSNTFRDKVPLGVSRIWRGESLLDIDETLFFHV